MQYLLGNDETEKQENKSDNASAASKRKSLEEGEEAMKLSPVAKGSLRTPYLIPQGVDQKSPLQILTILYFLRSYCVYQTPKGSESPYHVNDCFDKTHFTM